MEKREGGVFQKSSTWWSLFQHCVHPKEHKTQMREVWSSSKSKPVALIQSCNTPNPTMQPLAGKLSARVCVCICACVRMCLYASLKSLFLCVCHSLCIAELLEYVSVFFVIYSYVSRSVAEKLVQCVVVWVCPSRFRSSSSLCSCVCRVQRAKIRFVLLLHTSEDVRLQSQYRNNTEGGDQLWNRGCKLTTFDKWSKVSLPT